MKKIKFITTVLLVLLFLGCGASDEGSESADLLSQDNTVKHARVEIENRDLDAVRKNIYANVSRFDASVIAENWRDRDRIKSYGTLTVRVPSKNFTSIIEWLRETYFIKQMSIDARVTNQRDSKSGTIVDGIVYSEVYIYINHEIGFIEAFLIGVQYGGDALKYSLQTLVPVVTFLFPYGLLVLIIIILTKLITKQIRKLKNKK